MPWVWSRVWDPAFLKVPGVADPQTKTLNNKALSYHGSVAFSAPSAERVLPAPLPEAWRVWCIEQPSWTTFSIPLILLQLRIHLVHQVHSPQTPGDTSPRKTNKPWLFGGFRPQLGGRETHQFPGFSQQEFSLCWLLLFPCLDNND